MTMSLHWRFITWISASTHHVKIILLGIELYKTRNNISNHMNELYEQQNILYNL